MALCGLAWAGCISAISCISGVSLVLCTERMVEGASVGACEWAVWYLDSGVGVLPAFIRQILVCSSVSGYIICDLSVSSRFVFLESGVESAVINSLRMQIPCRQVAIFVRMSMILKRRCGSS